MLPISSEHPTRGAPIASRSLMVLCVIVFICQWLFAGAGSDYLQTWGFVPARLFTPEYAPWDVARQFDPKTLISYMFLHADLIHLLGNLLFMWIFAASVEAAVGHSGFVLFYLVCGAAAALVQAWMTPESVVPMVGASGGVSGVLGAYLFLHPRDEIKVVVPIFIVVRIVSLPAWTVLVFWFVVQLLYSIVPDPAVTGIAFEAHIGGFVAGLLLVPLFSRIFRLN